MGSHVQVALRIKPPKEDNSAYMTAITEPATLILTKPGSTDEMYNFSYTSMLENVDNALTYATIGTSVIASVLEGYNGTVMAYGQTGSGKTFTMLGPEGAREAKSQGVMPRALEELFTSLRGSPDIEDYTVKVTYVEIYQEEIRNLLAGKQGAKADTRIDVQFSKGSVTLTNVPLAPVESSAEAMELVDYAQSVRAQAAHNLNNRSSRSHTVLTVWVSTKHKAGGSFLSKLNLVDLAGSERMKQTGAVGKTAKEGTAINGSLLQLQLVVQDLARKGAVPSFRASKLTHMLRDSIGGNCKTTLVACVWGDPQYMTETLSTCKFAEGMMKVQVKATKNADGGLQAVHGHLVKLDPVVLAMMDKRVAAAVALEKAKLMEQYGHYAVQQGGDNSEYERLNADQQAELARLQAKVEELEYAGKEVQEAEAGGSVDPAVAEELEQLRLQLNAYKLNEMSERDDDVKDFRQMQDLRQKIQALKQVLQAGERELTAEEEEDLLFYRNELAELQHKHGMLDSPRKRDEARSECSLLDSPGGSESLGEPELDSEGSPDGGSKPGEAQAGGPIPNRAGPQSEWLKSEILKKQGGMDQQDDEWRDQESGIPHGRCSDAGMAGTGYVPWSTPDPNALPDDLQAPKKARGFGSSLMRMFSGSRGAKKAGLPMTADNLHQHDGYHAAPESRISIISTLSHANMVHELDQHNRVNPSMPLDLTAMPKKPKAPKRGISSTGRL